MTSPEPSGYPHHPHPHMYSHQEAPPLPPLPPPPPHHQGMSSHDVMYSDRPSYHHHHHYNPPPEHHHHHQPPPSFPTPPPPPHNPHHHLHHGHKNNAEPEQPLDLSLSRSPRPASAGTLVEGGPAPKPRSMLEEGSASAMREGSSDLGRADSHHHQPSPSVCMLRGCSCRHSPMPVHHAPHYSRGHRHSPYPQYPVSSSGGHGSSPAALGGGGDVREPPYSPHHYSIPQPSRSPLSSSSPGMMYGGRSSPYIQDRHSRSPGLGASAYGGGEMVPQRPSPGSLLCPPPHSSISPLSISTHVPRDPSSPSCPPPQSLAAPRMREVSPRPFYRPFEDVAHTLADVPHAAPVISSSSSGQMGGGAMEPYPSEDDLSASSTLLMLSNTTSEAGTGRPSVLTRQTAADSSVDNASFRQRREQQQRALLMEDGVRAHHAEPTQSDSGSRAGASVFHHPLPSPHPSSHVDSNHLCGNREARSREPYHHSENQLSLGPAQDGTVASSYSSDDLTDSPYPARGDERKSRTHLQQARMDTDSPSPTQVEGEGLGGKKKNVQPRSRFVTVVGTTPLAALREERAKKQAANKDKMKELLSCRSGGSEPQRQYNNNSSSNDSEGASSDLNSSGQASPRSSDGGLDNDVGQGFPIPPDPNLKMSALDYLISKVLVERVDVPFKACNSEIKEIYTGAKKGRLTLVDLIELQVEASLKA